MRYRDGQSIQVGDMVRIDVRHQGTVVACIEDGIYLHPHTREQWTLLHDGVLIDTTFGGVVHYPDQATLDSEEVELLSRLS
jgi:hypothetical protein